MLFLYIDQIYKIPFPYTKQRSHIPEAWIRYSFRAEISRIGTIESAPQGRGGGGGRVCSNNTMSNNTMLKIP